MPSTELPDGAPALIVVRHGETEWSRTGQHTGRSDIALTDVGERQARAAGSLVRAVLGDREPDLVISSPRSRALRTAELAGFAAGEVTEDAAEWNYGELEGMTTPQIAERLPDWTVWNGPVPGGETADDVTARVDRLLARRGVGQVMLVFSHGHLSRCLAARWLGEPVAFGRFLRLGTGAVSSLGFEHGTPAVVRWNLDSTVAGKAH